MALLAPFIGATGATRVWKFGWLRKSSFLCTVNLNGWPSLMPNGWMDGWCTGLMDGRNNGRIEGWQDLWRAKWKSCWTTATPNRRNDIRQA